MIPNRIRLNSGSTIPTLGLGVYKTSINVTNTLVTAALNTGYRHVDCAQFYRNEHEVCQGIAAWLKQNQETNKREDIFYTTKIFDTDHGYFLAKKAIELSLERAKDIEYIDLMLIHSPQSDYERRHGTWMALQDAVASGLVRNIGVSNYNVKHIEELLAYQDLKIIPAVNQIELHPWMARREIVEYCQQKEIKLEAYSPLVKGQKMNDEGLMKIAKKYGKTPAQILFNWSLSRGFIALPKTVTPERLLPNLESASFQLAREDMELLDSWDENYVTGWDPTIYPLDHEE